jgi:ATP-binding cassette subfamily C protein
MIKLFFKDLKFLIGKRLLLYVYFVFIISSLVAVLDVISISSIALFIGVILEPQNFLSDYLDYKLVNTYYNLEVLNRVIIGSLLILTIFVIKNLLGFANNYLNAQLTYEIKVYLSKKLFTSYLYREYSFHINKNPSTLWKNIITEVAHCSTYVSLISSLLGSVILILGILFIIIFNSTIYFTSIFLFLSLLVYILLTYFKKQVRALSEKRAFYDAQSSKSINQALGSIKETILFNRENWFIKIFGDSIKVSEKQKKILTVINSFPRLVIELFSIIILLSIFVIFIYKNYAITEILPFLTLITLSLLRLIPVFTLISVHINSLRFLNVSKKIIFKEFSNANKRKKIDNRNTISVSKKEKFKSLRLRNVNFSYDKNKKIINNLNFTIKNKDRVLFVGPSGSGKSTIVNLLLGLLKPTSGKILFNNSDVNNDIQNFHSKIGYIPQDIYLLDDSIKKNIVFSDTECDENTLEWAIERSELSKDIKKFQKGVSTIIGHRGRKLSGGQKQRLALARALYKRPEILVMDEPTSSLDEFTEMKIIKTLFNSSRNLTIIMVAHRVKNFKKKFNKIVTLK